MTMLLFFVMFCLLLSVGQEDFDRLRPIAYQDVDVALMCFDLTQAESLENCENKWKGELDYFMKSTPFILVGRVLFSSGSGGGGGLWRR